MKTWKTVFSLLLLFSVTVISCVSAADKEKPAQPIAKPEAPKQTLPLISGIYTADPSAHVFDGKIYIYPSHDLDEDAAADMDGGQYNMKDYHVFSMDSVDSKPIDHGEVLNIKDVPWAGKQMWAPDAAYKNGKYYFYFPAKDKDEIFRIGAAVSDNPAGPFVPEKSYIPGSFSMDPAVFIDDDGTAYMYFGGLWGGQLEKWTNGKYDENGSGPSGTKPALGPYVAVMNGNMKEFASGPAMITIRDQNGAPISAGDNIRRFFEAAWMHKYNGKYYLSYSTGDTHLIVYAIGDNPTGPFTYKGIVLKPVTGWTNHHSIIEFQGKWYLFYHDCTISKGVDHMRNVKMTELFYNEDGTIRTIDPYPNN